MHLQVGVWNSLKGVPATPCTPPTHIHTHIPEGFICVEIFTQWLSHASFICVLVLERKRELLCHILGCFLVPALTDDNMIKPCILATCLGFIALPGGGVGMGVCRIGVFGLCMSVEIQTTCIHIHFVYTRFVYTHVVYTFRTLHVHYTYTTHKHTQKQQGFRSGAIKVSTLCIQVVDPDLMLFPHKPYIFVCKLVCTLVCALVCTLVCTLVHILSCQVYTHTLHIT